MITHYPFDTLGGANHGWLNAKHHFSFANYYDPKKMGFGELLVINDDRIAPNTGFGKHPHDNMEIITFVRKGAISHEDSQGNNGRTTAGNVQVMSAGKGILHSEYNHEDEETNIFQIWITPKSRDIEPKWGSAEFPTTTTTDKLKLLVSGNNDAPLQIHQDARIYTGMFKDNTTLKHLIKGQGYLLVSKGNIKIGDIEASKGDGIAIKNEEEISLECHPETEIILIEVPGLVEAR
tara:strand:+ start:333 stop:1037 length:705 start_codon:yes stop_codon:yes gene_type:complete